MPFLSDLTFTEPGLLRGHVLLDNQPERQWHVGLFVNGQLLGATPADLPVDLGCNTGWIGEHGFRFSLNPRALQDADVLRVEVLNAGHIIFEQAFLNLRKTTSPVIRGPGSLRHARGLMLSGTVENGVTDLPSYEILAMEGDRIVGRCRVNRWEHIGNPQDPLGRAAAFDLHLDSELADGQVHRLHVETSTGIVLEGSPVDVIAWPNRLRAGLIAAASGNTPAHARRAEAMLDRLLGLGMPLSAYTALYPELAAPPPRQRRMAGSARTAFGSVWVAPAGFYAAIRRCNPYPASPHDWQTPYPQCTAPRRCFAIWRCDKRMVCSGRC